MNFIKEGLLVKVNDVKSIPNEQGLYILNTDLNMIKLGMSLELKKRIKQYKTKSEICYIVCNGSKYRENAMLDFLKNKLNIIPFYKDEYFNCSRYILDRLIKLFGTCEDNFIMNGFNEEQIKEIKEYILEGEEVENENKCKKCLEYELIINDLKSRLEKYTNIEEKNDMISISLEEDIVRDAFVKYYNRSIIIKGIRGVCELFIKHVCKDIGLVYVNINSFKYKNNSGEIVYICTSKLIEIIKDGIYYALNNIDNIRDEYLNLKEDSKYKTTKLCLKLSIASNRSFACYLKAIIEDIRQ
jgi:hypothetical protein